MPRPSNTEHWAIHGEIVIPIKPNQDVYTCTINGRGIPSTTDSKHKNKKAIVIILE